MTTGSGTRKYELDHLRVVATAGVILLHTGAFAVVFYRDSAPDLWSNFNAGNLAESLGRFAVNGFFMASGALLLDTSRRFVLRTQVLRVALPALTWLVIYALVNVLLDHQGVRGVNGTLKNPVGSSPTELVRALLAGPAVYHLWFVYVLVGIYLAVPLLRAVTGQPEPTRRNLVMWFLLLWVVGNLTLWSGPFLVGERFPSIYPSPFDSWPAGYVGLFMLGFVLTHYRDRLRVPSSAWALVALVGFAWTFTSVWLRTSNGDADPLAAYGNLNPPVLVLSIGVFAWWATRSRGPGPVWPLVKRLSELSFRVYLLHALVLHLLLYTTPLGTLVRDHTPVGLLAVYVSTVLISVAAAWTLDLVRPFRRFI